VVGVELDEVRSAVAGVASGADRGVDLERLARGGAEAQLGHRDPDPSRLDVVGVEVDDDQDDVEDKHH